MECWRFRARNMPKPQKETRDKMYDTFSDFDLASQEIVLACLQELHRQAKRKANKELAETLYPSGTSETAGPNNQYPCVLQ